MRSVKNISEMPDKLYGVSGEEKETIIRKDYLEKCAYICTTNNAEYHKFIKLCYKNPEFWKALGYDIDGDYAQTGYFKTYDRMISYRSGKRNNKKLK